MKTDNTELQKLDCNCNDCKFMIRDMAKFKESETTHDRWQKNHFDGIVARMQRGVDEHYKAQDFNAGYDLEKKAKAMKYQFDRKECAINYGTCEKFSKGVSFIPGVLQLETQKCFEHRKSNF